MSLQVWLSGNNTMTNQGLLGDLIQTTAPTYVDGKFGKSMSTGAYKMSAEQTAQVLNNEAVSICFWVYINADEGTTDNRVMFFGTNSMVENNNRKFSLYNYPTVNDLHWSWMNDTARNTFTSGVLSGVFPSYQWTHVAVTYQNPNGSVYINGEKVHSFTGISDSSTFAYETQVIYNSSYLRWNDYRIYDHCLSPFEVKQISQGLVTHFKLSNQYETGQVNKYSGDVAEGSLRNTVFTKTKLENERGYNYKLTYTGTGSNTWPNIDTGSTFTFTPGKTYFYSCKVRCHTANFNITLRAARSGNDWVTNMRTVVSSSLADGEWHEYYVSQTINETYVRSGSTIICDPILEFYSESLSTADKVYSADFDIKDIQVIESDCYVPFIDDSMVSSTTSDCSGHGNDGTMNGTITWSADSPRYTGSYELYKDSYISFNNAVKGSSEFTANIWVWSDAWGEFLMNMVTCYDRDGDDNQAGWVLYLNNTTNKIRFGLVLEGFGFVAGSTVTLLSDLSSGWHMFTAVYTGYGIRIYIDGNLDKSGSLNVDSPVPVIYGGNYLGICPAISDTTHAKVSDCRIYSTALSDSDIKSLYEVSASVDKTGILSAYEFVERG